MILGVNIDHVATVRQARGGEDPDPLVAAALALRGGANGITVHLREDRRHIQDRDLKLLRKAVGAELNLEMAAVREMIEIALKVKPDMVTLVPEKRAELTTEGGLDVRKNSKKIVKAIDAISARGIPVSLFINPSARDVELSRRIGAHMVEIHTGLFSNARGKTQKRELERVKKAVQRALSLRMRVNAGHGLNYVNVAKIASIRGLRGLYIGHSIVSRAVLIGMKKAVREMKDLIERSAR